MIPLWLALTLLVVTHVAVLTVVGLHNLKATEQRATRAVQRIRPIHARGRMRRIG